MIAGHGGFFLWTFGTEVEIQLFNLFLLNFYLLLFIHF